MKCFILILELVKISVTTVLQGFLIRVIAKDLLTVA